MNEAETLEERIKKPIVTQCCVCKKIKRYYGYVDVGEPILKAIKQHYDISHSYCEPCLSVEYKKHGITRRQE